MHSKLQAVVDTMELYQATFPEDACIVVTDTDELVGYRPGKTIDLKLQLGIKASNFHGTVTERALSQKLFFREEKGPEQFGFAYISTAQPIFYGSQLTGVAEKLLEISEVDG